MILRQSALHCRGTVPRSLPKVSDSQARRCLLSQTTQWRSSTTTQSKPNILYPESLRVFLAPGGQTQLYGFMRVLTGFVWYAGSFLLAPYVYFNPDMETWKVPLILAASPVPMLASCLFGPYVSAINIQIPASARRSQEALMSFATKIPPKTKVSFVYMRFRPWPHRMSASFDELRRIEKRSGGTWAANLELVPKANEAKMKKSPIYAWFVQKYMGEYWVNVEQNKNTVPRPHVWKTIWDQIPTREQQVKRDAVQQKVPSGPASARMKPPTSSASRGAVRKRP